MLEARELLKIESSWLANTTLDIIMSRVLRKEDYQI